MIIYLLAILLSLFSASVMAYISMATSIGPWISPTLLLMLYALYGACWQKPTVTQLLGITGSASIAGIAATACGFSFPALFFLDAQLYQALVAQPYHFMILLGGLVALASLFGMWIAHLFETAFLSNNAYQFPIGQMIFTMASTGHNHFQTMQLWAGGILFFLWTWAQKGTRFIKIPSIITTKPLHFFVGTVPALRFDLTIMPLLVAIGFVAGHVIAKPLLVGAFGRLCVLNPLHTYFFSSLNASEFLLAFCAGMVLCGALQAIWLLPKSFNRYIQNIRFGHYKIAAHNGLKLMQDHILQLLLFLLFFMVASYYLALPLIVQLYTLVTTFLCVYQMMIIGATMGIAPLGRFATFVMVPALFLFSLNYTQLICLATFVEIAGGVAVDILFSRKACALANIPKTFIVRMQYLGIAIASVGCAAVFLLLSSKFQLGSTALGAYKAQARALLIHAHQFNYAVIVIGIFFGWALGKCKINPSMVLGGILMPLDYSCALIVGGFVAQCFDQKEKWIPFASALFAANSLWMLIQGYLG